MTTPTSPNSETPTPETDAQVMRSFRVYDEEGHQVEDVELVFANFARSLERRLADKAKINEEALRNICLIFAFDPSDGEGTSGNGVYELVQKSVTALRSALSEATKRGEDNAQGYAKIIREMTDEAVGKADALSVTMRELSSLRAQLERTTAERDEQTELARNALNEHPSENPNYVSVLRIHLDSLKANLAIERTKREQAEKTMVEWFKNSEAERQRLRAELLSLSLASEGMKSAIARIHRAWVYFVNNPNAPIAATASMDGAVHNALEALSTPTPPIVQQVVEGLENMSKSSLALRKELGPEWRLYPEYQDFADSCDALESLLSLLGKDGKDAFLVVTGEQPK